MNCEGCAYARYSSGGMGTPIEFLGCSRGVCVLIEGECTGREEVDKTPDVPNWSNVR